MASEEMPKSPPPRGTATGASSMPAPPSPPPVSTEARETAEATRRPIPRDADEKIELAMSQLEEMRKENDTMRQTMMNMQQIMMQTMSQNQKITEEMIERTKTREDTTEA